ncbi:MAG TPA: transcriptional regulator, partial [Cyanobacteria bacterium UBA11162]|nr:transcriptional regulator [Cyanobacteria bacterium UBA11162]
RCFPCTELQTIDQIWINASQGRFGFSVQKDIYVQSGGVLDSQIA